MGFTFIIGALAALVGIVTTLQSDGYNSWSGRWKNWDLQHSSQPLSFSSPSTEEEIISIVHRAASAGETVRVVGAGHSFSPVATTAGHMVSLDNYKKVVQVDGNDVTVEAGIRLYELHQQLDSRGLALVNMGMISQQSIAGAVTTGTHGTGRLLGSLSSQIVGIRLIKGNGEVVECGPKDDCLHASAVSMGALGIISRVTVRCTKAFSLNRVESGLTANSFMDSHDDYLREYNRVQFMWIPTPGNAGLSIGKMVRWEESKQPAPKSVWATTVVETAQLFVYGVALDIATYFPSTVDGVRHALSSSLVTPSVTLLPSYIALNVAAVPPVYTEIELMVSYYDAKDAYSALVGLLDSEKWRSRLPIAVCTLRFVAADEAWLSPSFGRPTAVFSVTMHKEPETFIEFSKDLQFEFRRFDARPHWGKLNHEKASQLSPLYPRWSDFQNLRKEFDPEGVFESPYLNRVLGRVE